MNATDFTMADVDLDHFLDNYLVQLGGDNHAASQNRVQSLDQRQQQNTGFMGLQQLGGTSNPMGGQMGGFGQMGQIPGSSNQQMPMNAMAMLQQQQLLQQLTNGLGGGLSGGLGGFSALASAPSLGKGGLPKSARSKGGRGKLKSDDQSSEDDGSDDDDDDDDDDGGEPRSRKKLALGGDDAERKHLALQEKNRRAQRRFRERQKASVSVNEILPLQQLTYNLLPADQTA